MLQHKHPAWCVTITVTCNAAIQNYEKEKQWLLKTLYLRFDRKSESFSCSIWDMCLSQIFRIELRTNFSVLIQTFIL
jgi:hypothetical protein